MPHRHLIISRRPMALVCPGDEPRGLCFNEFKNLRNEPNAVVQNRDLRERSARLTSHGLPLNGSKITKRTQRRRSEPRPPGAVSASHQPWAPLNGSKITKRTRRLRSEPRPPGAVSASHQPRAPTQRFKNYEANPTPSFRAATSGSGQCVSPAMGSHSTVQKLRNKPKTFFRLRSATGLDGPIRFHQQPREGSG